MVNNSLKDILCIFVSGTKDIFRLHGTIYLPIFCLITGSTVRRSNGTGVPLVTYVAILSEDQKQMQQTEKSMPGVLTRPRTAIAMIAATLFLGGTVTEASAKSGHHHHHHRHHHLDASN